MDINLSHYLANKFYMHPKTHRVLCLLPYCHIVNGSTKSNVAFFEGKMQK